MQPRLVPVVLLLLLQSCVNAQHSNLMHDVPPPAPQAEVIPAAAQTAANPSAPLEFQLRDYQWQHRVVLVFAASSRSPAYQQLLQQWQSQLGNIRDRQLKLVEIIDGAESRADGRAISPIAATRLRQQFKIASQDFAMILVGKDGTEKQRSPRPIDLAQLFRTIDAMPMRQQEMRSQLE